jgi:hypothetical protein
MLSIRLDAKTEWWVSGGVFDRLFEAALRNGSMPSHLERWLHVADANGGLDVSQLPAADSSQLIAALRSTAEGEVRRLSHASADTADGSYRFSLQKLLALEIAPKTGES